MNRNSSIRIFPLLLLIAIISCESEKRIPPRGYIPVKPESTEKLEAAYFWVSQDQLNSPYWKDATFVEATLSDGNTENLYPDGYLNMTGTYHGLSDFNEGKNPEVIIKAGYDSEYLYILVEWKDTTTDASLASRLFVGPDDPLKPDSVNGWTSQRNNDNLTILFPMEGEGFDAWKWNMSYTAPLNMALNLSADNSGNINDDSELLNENSVDGSPRGRPKYEWNGERQEISLPDGTRRLLDPAYYLLDEMKTEFIGDMAKGQRAFNLTADCRFCHGPDGNGISDGFTNGGALNDVFTNRYSREGLIDFIDSPGHEGRGPQYWGRIKNDSAAVVDIITFMRGIAGVPGNSIIVPSTEAEVRAFTSVGTGTVSKQNSMYQILLRRRLKNGVSGDIQFSPENNYSLSIRLSDNDDINFIESQNIELIFKSKAL